MKRRHTHWMRTITLSTTREENIPLEGHRLQISRDPKSFSDTGPIVVLIKAQQRLIADTFNGLSRRRWENYRQSIGYFYKPHQYGTCMGSSGEVPWIEQRRETSHLCNWCEMFDRRWDAVMSGPARPLAFENDSMRPGYRAHPTHLKFRTAQSP